MAVAREIEGSLQVGFDDIEVSLRRLQTSVDLLELARDTFLLSLQQVERDRSGIVGLQQLCALSDEPLLLRSEVAPLGFGVATVRTELIEECHLDVST